MKQKKVLRKPIVVAFNTTEQGKDELDRLAAAVHRRRSEYIELAARGIIPVDRSVLEK